jgi:hypothetical protein
VGTSKRHGTSVLASNLEYGSAVEDIDIITPSTESTSILTDATLINIKKPRDGRLGRAARLHDRDAGTAFRRVLPALGR